MPASASVAVCVSIRVTVSVACPCLCVCVCVTVCNYLPSIAWACVSARTRTTDCTLLAWAEIHPRLRLPLHRCLHRSLLRCLLLCLSVYLSAWQFNCLHSSCCWFLSGFAFTVARLKLPIPIVLWPERTRFNRAGFVWISWDLLSLLPLPALRFFAFFSFCFFLSHRMFAPFTVSCASAAAAGGKRDLVA